MIGEYKGEREKQGAGRGVKGGIENGKIRAEEDWNTEMNEGSFTIFCLIKRYYV